MENFELKSICQSDGILEYYRYFKDGIDFELPCAPEFKLQELRECADCRLGSTQRLYASYDNASNVWVHGIHIAYDKSKIPNGGMLDHIMIDLCKKFGVKNYRLWDGYQVATIDDHGDMVSFLDLEALLPEN